MKRKLLFARYAFAFLVLGMMTFSCKKDIKNPDQAVTVQLAADPNFVTFSAAGQAARRAEYSRLINGILSNPTNTGRPAKGNSALRITTMNTANASEKQVTDSLAFPSASEPSLYVFNYAGNGFVIISSDKRIQPILAYSDKGHFKYSSSLAPGLLSWLNVNDKNMKGLRKSNVNKPLNNAKVLWAEVAKPVAGAQGLAVNQVAPPPPPCETGWTTTASAGPLLNTDWGQGDPYNLMCPYDIYSVTGNNYDVTGCLATAVGQVMHYWQYPTSYGGNTYSWTGMPLVFNGSATTAGLSSVQQLMHDLGLSSNLALTYTFNETYGYSTSISGTFSNFGYSSVAYNGNYQYTDYPTMESNLNYGWPVVLCGQSTQGGHSWVCDGYSESTYTDCEGGWGETFYPIFHMNWGWDGTGTGWYAYNDWSVYMGPGATNMVSFNYGLTMNYNIHP